MSASNVSPGHWTMFFINALLNAKIRLDINISKETAILFGQKVQWQLRWAFYLLN